MLLKKSITRTGFIGHSYSNS